MEDENVRVLARAEWRPTPDNPRPDVSFVPPMERRRLTGVERAAISVAHKVYPEGDEIPVVFASRWGEIGTTVKLMRQCHDDGEMSPAGFAASVHNAAPGVFSLLTKNRAPYTAIAARSRSREMGWLEATSMKGRVVFVYAEEDTPEFYRPKFGEPETAHAEAFLLEVGGA